MKRAPASIVNILLGSFCAMQLILAPEAGAYVDPGTTGLLSQILYVLFYGALGVFFYFLRYIKQYLVNAKQILAKLVGRDS